MANATRQTLNGSGLAASFFGSKQQKKLLVDVGGKGDCGFRSVAAAFLDNCKTHQRIDSQLISKLLTSHFEWHKKPPELLSGMLTPAEKIKILLDVVGYDVLIETLAFTLRQLAVNQMGRDPVRYRGSFILKNEGTSLSEMRKQGTWIDETAIAALAIELGVSIRVNVVRSDLDVPLVLSYNEAAEHPATNPKLSIQLKNGHYQAYLNSPYPSQPNKKISSSSAYHPSHVKSPLADPSEADVSKLIAEDNIRLAQLFDQTKNQLTNLVTHGSLNKDDLLDIYIKGMENSDYLRGRVKYIGIEHGNQDFFDQAISEARYHETGSMHSKKTNYSDNYDKEQMIIAELSGAIARAVSIGHMDMDKDILAVITAKEDESITYKRNRQGG